jgi:LmbE family N-acetylglucosaminyl deacetylase
MALALVVGLISGVVTAVRLISNYTAPTEVVIVAHEDDWQLFMGDVLTTRMRSGNRAIFVYVTAGDNGRDSLYWLAREKAALGSTRLAIMPDARYSAPVCGVVQVIQHSITECDLGQTRSYFLRLPDGRRNGHGFASTRYQSLRKLRDGKITVLEALDGSTTYRGWSDLRNTVAALIPNDSAPVVLDTMDPSVARNPHDHFDHRMAGILATELGLSRQRPITYYVGYALATRAANRTAEEAQLKTELLIAYDREMVAISPAWSAYREHPSFYTQCMRRTYSNTFPRQAKRP